MKRAFTLMEVNLAVFIMAVGVLAMVALYPLGFRENQQSAEDVNAAIAAESVLGPLVAALSYTNLYWSEWCGLCGGGGQKAQTWPAKGWKDYCRDVDRLLPATKGAINSRANEVINKISQAYRSSGGQGNPSSDAKLGSDYAYALVATYGHMKNENGVDINDYSRICLCLRFSKRPSMLFAQPMFYTEVHFQGDPNK